ncbi:MAG: hypothetical protein AAF772_05470 [Acidobacteriota bacterium]
MTQTAPTVTAADDAQTPLAARVGGVLLIALTLTLAAATTFYVRQPPKPFGAADDDARTTARTLVPMAGDATAPSLPGEDTLLMQALSLAHDGDLRYARIDHDRFAARLQRAPRDLALVSADDGHSLTFAPAPLYALLLAPLARALDPLRAAATLNVLLFIGALVVARVRLRPRTGPWIDLLLLAALAAGGVAPYLFLATGDALRLAAALAGAALLLPAPSDDDGAPTAAARWRLRASGALLSVPALHHAPDLLLLAAALLLVRRGRLALLQGSLGFVALIGLAMGIASGGLPGVTTVGTTFDARTGLPLVDLPILPGTWNYTARQLEALHFTGGARFGYGLDAALWRWNALYGLAGRHVGALPYHVGLLAVGLAGLLLARRWRWLGIGAGALALFALLLLLAHPFDLAGGPATFGNRRTLALLTMLMVVGLGALRWRAAPALLTAALALLVAAPFQHALWTTPWQPPLDASGLDHAYPTVIARAHLPYETSQRTLPGGTTLELDGVRVRCLDEAIWPKLSSRTLVVDGSRRGALLLTSGTPLRRLRLEFGPDAPSQLTVDGATLGERLLTPDGGIAFQVEPQPLAPHHPLWWTPNRQHLYRIGLQLPDAPDQPLVFHLRVDA